MEANTNEIPLDPVNMLAIWLSEAARQLNRTRETREIIRHAADLVAENYGLPNEDDIEHRDAQIGFNPLPIYFANFASKWDECERIAKDEQYANTLAAVEKLPLHSQVELAEEVKRNVARQAKSANDAKRSLAKQKKRDKLVAEIEEARKEFESGQCKPMTAAEISREAHP